MTETVTTRGQGCDRVGHDRKLFRTRQRFICTVTKKKKKKDPQDSASQTELVQHTCPYSSSEERN